MPAPILVTAVDLDDTLLRSDGELSPRTLAALQAWLAAGRRVVIATGRPPRTIAEKLPALLQNAAWICYNGAEVRQQGNILYQNYIPSGVLPETIGRVLDQHPDATIGMEIDDLLWLNRERSRPGHYRVADLRTMAHLSTPKVLFFSERLSELMAILEPPPAGTRLMPSGRYQFTQMMSSSADKASALHVLLNRWGLSAENVIAFGDDVNDVELLQAAGIGVAVANALDSVKAAADRITASNDDDGVALVLEELLANADGGHV